MKKKHSKIMTEHIMLNNATALTRCKSAKKTQKADEKSDQAPDEIYRNIRTSNCAEMMNSLTLHD